MPAANTEAMAEHPLEISAMFTPGVHAPMVCDEAGFHQPDNISLLRLPFHAPDST